MKKFLLITADGFTQDMEWNDVENYQVLGCAEGWDFCEAVEKFKSENVWFGEYKFEDMKGYKVMSFKEVS